MCGCRSAGYPIAGVRGSCPQGVSCRFGSTGPLIKMNCRGAHINRALVEAGREAAGMVVS